MYESQGVSGALPMKRNKFLWSHRWSHHSLCKSVETHKAPSPPRNWQISLNSQDSDVHDRLMAFFGTVSLSSSLLVVYFRRVEQAPRVFRSCVHIVAHPVWAPSNVYHISVSGWALDGQARWWWIWCCLCTAFENICMWRETPAHHHHHHYHHDLGGQSYILDTYSTPPYPLPWYIPETTSEETLELYSSPQTSTMQQIDLNDEEKNTSSFSTHKQGLVRWPSIQAFGGHVLCTVFFHYFHSSEL